MKPLAEIFAKYRGEDCRSGCDKGSVHSYIDVYETLFSAARAKAKTVVEIGIMTGHSLRMWEEYFAGAAVYGIDTCDRPLNGMADLRPMIAEGGHNIVLGDATDARAMHHAFGQTAFDVIIEDASHNIAQQLDIYSVFKRRLAPGGIYVIEDVEDIDSSRRVLEAIDPEKSVRIIDRRNVKGRFDDVLVVIS